MTWWVLDEAIRESVLSPPCKLVLRTLADQLNPPKDWDAKHPDDWDPSTHPENLTVWCDRTTLSHATGYKRNQLRLITRKLVHEYKVLRLLTPARQHYTAHWLLDLEALRRLCDPWFAQRRVLQEARRRRSGGQTLAPTSRHGTNEMPREHTDDRKWREQYDAKYGYLGGRR